MPIPGKPLALTDRQLEIIFVAAEPMVFDDRPAFLREVAEALGSPFRLSDEIVARVCAAVQSKYPAAPPADSATLYDAPWASGPGLSKAQKARIMLEEACGS
jgi:hypothetical protein